MQVQLAQHKIYLWYDFGHSMIGFWTWATVRCTIIAMGGKWTEERKNEKTRVRLNYVFNNNGNKEGILSSYQGEAFVVCALYIDATDHKLQDCWGTWPSNIFKNLLFKETSKWNLVRVNLLCATSAYSFLHNWIMIIELQNIFMNSIQNQVTIATAY